MDLDLRQLRHCRALAEEGNFARAARSLHITQPALSRSIADLERRLGLQLFERGRSGVVPTDVGRAFLDRAAGLLAHAESVEREAVLLKGSAAGALNVGSATYVSALFMAPAVAQFVAAHPGVALRIANDNWASLVAMLRRRELDLVVGQPPREADAADLDLVPLSERQGFVFVRPQHPLASRADCSLADITAYPFATTARVGAVIAELLTKARAGVRASARAPDFCCESFPMLEAVTRATDHVLLANFSIVADALARSELVALPLVEPRLRATFAVMRLSNRTLPQIAQALVQAIVVADRASAKADQAREAAFKRQLARGSRSVAPVA